MKLIIVVTPLLDLGWDSSWQVKLQWKLYETVELIVCKSKSLFYLDVIGIFVYQVFLVANTILIFTEII